MTTVWYPRIREKDVLRYIGKTTGAKKKKTAKDSNERPNADSRGATMSVSQPQALNQTRPASAAAAAAVPVKLSDTTTRRALTADEERGRRLWRSTLSPIFTTQLLCSNLDGSTVPTYVQLSCYDDVCTYLQTRMKATRKDSGLHVNILRTIIMREVGLTTEQCSVAMVAAAIWENGLCDKDAWRVARSADAMFIRAEFYSDEARYNCVRKSVFHDPGVPVRFKHRMAATVAAIYHAARNPNLAYICSGMDFLLPAAHAYYVALRREITRKGCEATCLTYGKIPTADWCRTADFFRSPRLARALAVAGSMDNALLQDVPCIATGDFRQYTWLPAVVFYMADMETVSTAIMITPLIRDLQAARSWDAFEICPVPHE